MHQLVEALVGERGQWGPAVRHAVAWAAALALAVSVALFALKAAFVWSLAGGGGGGRVCVVGTVRDRLDGGGKHVCVPARMARRSGANLLVLPAFVGLAVAASSCFVRALAVGRRHDEYF